MGLKITNPAEEYPYVFMLSQTIGQRTLSNQSDTPYYTLSLVWTYYKLDAEGNITYDHNTQHSYYDDSFYITSVADYQAGEPTHINTLTAQESSIKRIVEQETGQVLEVI